MRKFIIITTAKNEEINIERCILSVVKQSITPAKWYIVDDNSNDNTVNIINKYASLYEFIKLIRKTYSSTNEYGSNIIEAFRYGIQHIDIDDYDYICNLDADIEIDSPIYYETLLNIFDNDSKLGILSGITYYYYNRRKKIVHHNPWVTTGALKMYRRECFTQLGGPLPILSWDGLDDYRAISRGWKTKTIYNLTVNHLGKYKSLNREKNDSWYKIAGRSYYLRGYSLFYILLKSLRFLFTSNPKHAIIFIKSYLNSLFKNELRMVNKIEIHTIHKYQWINISNYIKKFLLGG